MSKTSTILFFLLSFTALGCETEDELISPAGNDGGKADDVDGEGTAELDCAPAEELSLELSGNEANNHIRATCHDSAGFAEEACCDAAGLYEAYEAATSCPARVEIGEGARCRDSGTGSFVASACCADLCGPVERNSAGQCINTETGQFDEEMCCFLGDALADNACNDDAQWVSISVNGEDHDACRNTSTGRFAMNSCCAAQCVQEVSDAELSLASIPPACAAQIEFETPEAECPDSARENSAGICHDSQSGRFVKSACCEARGPVAVLCGFDQDPIFGVFPGGETPDGVSIEPSDQLEEAIGGVRLLERSEIETNVLMIDQVKAAVLHDGSLLPADRRGLDEFTLDEVLDGVDYEEVFYGTGEVGGVQIDWVQFFSGDTEVGAVFVADTLELVADIGDGDISGCSPA